MRNCWLPASKQRTNDVVVVVKSEGESSKRFYLRQMTRSAEVKVTSRGSTDRAGTRLQSQRRHRDLKVFKSNLKEHSVFAIFMLATTTSYPMF